MIIFLDILLCQSQNQTMAKKSNTQVPVLLGTPAVRQILARLSKSEKEENALVEKVLAIQFYFVIFFFKF